MWVNGKKTKKTESESKFTQESAVIKDIGKTACETARVLWFTQIKIFILVHGKMEKKKVKVLISSLKLEWNTLVILEMDKCPKVNGFTRMELTSKAILIIISQKDQALGISEMKILLKVNIARSREQMLTRKTKLNLPGKLQVK